MHAAEINNETAEDTEQCLHGEVFEAPVIIVKETSTSIGIEE
jgi:hypothetical protein